MKILIATLVGFFVVWVDAKTLEVPCTFEIWLQTPLSSTPIHQGTASKKLVVQDPITYQGKRVGVRTEYQFHDEFKIAVTINFSNHPFDPNQKELRIINTKGFWVGADAATTGNDLKITGRQPGLAGSFTNEISCDFPN